MSTSTNDRPRTWLPWILSVVGNVLLGYAGTVPFLFLAVVVEGTILKNLGWNGAAPPLGDDVSVAFLIGGAGTAVVLALFVGFNRLLARRSTVRGWPYWLVSIVLLLVPVVLVIVWPGLWQNIRWY